MAACHFAVHGRIRYRLKNSLPLAAHRTAWPDRGNSTRNRKSDEHELSMSHRGANPATMALGQANRCYSRWRMSPSEWGPRRNPETMESHCLVFPKPQVPSTTPAARSRGSWACPLLDATSRASYRIGPQRPSSLQGQRGGNLFSHLHIVPACWISCPAIAWTGWRAAHQVRPANVALSSALRDKQVRSNTYCKCVDNKVCLQVDTGRLHGRVVSRMLPDVHLSGVQMAVH